MAEESIEKNKFTLEELQSKSYRWRKESKRIKFFIFTVSKVDKEEKRSREHCHALDHKENLDPDLCHLLKDFIKPLTENYEEDKEILKNKTADEVMKQLEKMKSDKKLYDYDCFFFILLTLIAGADSKDKYKGLPYGFGKTHINLDEVYKCLDEVDSMLNKPKVFLIQADSISLLKDLRTVGKGTKMSARTMKIPHEADRITIMSTVPSLKLLKPKPDDKGDSNSAEKEDDEGSSPLIEAFLDAMKENNKKPREKRADFFSLTGRMNELVKEKLDGFEKEHPDFKHKDLTVPLVTSTLRRELIF